MTDRLGLAFRMVDHAYFCLDERGNPFPQTSAPDVIARTLRALDVQAGSHVLEIGTGSGYSTALLGELIGPGGLVASIDVDPPVTARARSLLSSKGYTTVHVTTGDGRLGLPAFAPYDRVVAWCSVDEVPQAPRERCRARANRRALSQSSRAAGRRQVARTHPRPTRRAGTGPAHASGPC
jgi:protein-L-isoaspartate(D-aspartate) O-methyltransferase